jgi:hypothetical protein
MGIITDVADSDNDDYSTVFLNCIRHHLLYAIYLAENNGGQMDGKMKEDTDGRQREREDARERG